MFGVCLQQKMPPEKHLINIYFKQKKTEKSTQNSFLRIRFLCFFLTENLKLATEWSSWIDLESSNSIWCRISVNDWLSIFFSVLMDIRLRSVMDGVDVLGVVSPSNSRSLRSLSCLTMLSRVAWTEGLKYFVRTFFFRVAGVFVSVLAVFFCDTWTNTND